MADHFTVEVHGPISALDVRLFACFGALKSACRADMQSTVDDAAMAAVALARSLQALAREHAVEAEKASARVVIALFSRFVGVGAKI